MDADFPSDYRLVEIGETTSTNDSCREAALAGDPGRLWIRAERQTASRGSRGRSWVSIEGNLLASLLLIDPAPREQAFLLSYVAGLAVRGAIARLAQEQRLVRDISLKWPNDVLVSGKKVSGILLEQHAVGPSMAVVIGIGINCVGHPQETLHRASDLQSEGFIARAPQLMQLLAEEMAQWLAIHDRGAGFQQVRKAWMENASGLGSDIFVRLPGREMSGVFEEIDEASYLVLSLDDGSRIRLSAADVFLSNPARNG
jgi:BirA family biotin operon repressor/biotin-[acetyl-CoA-carboxylase] ligase